MNLDEDRSRSPDNGQFPEEFKNLVIKIFSGSLNIRSQSVFFAALLGEKVLVKEIIFSSNISDSHSLSDP